MGKAVRYTSVHCLETAVCTQSLAVSPVEYHENYYQIDMYRIAL